MKEFNVLRWDFNSDSLVHYNVLPYFIECFYNRVKASKKPDYDKRYYKVPETIEDFKEFIESESRYRFWARCEYEMICHGWPVRKNDHKLDIHEQIMMNIDVLAEILFTEITANEIIKTLEKS